MSHFAETPRRSVYYFTIFTFCSTNIDYTACFICTEAHVWRIRHNSKHLLRQIPDAHLPRERIWKYFWKILPVFGGKILSSLRLMLWFFVFNAVITNLYYSQSILGWALICSAMQLKATFDYWTFKFLLVRCSVALVAGNIVEIDRL